MLLLPSVTGRGEHVPLTIAGRELAYHGQKIGMIGKRGAVPP